MQKEIIQFRANRDIFSPVFCRKNVRCLLMELQVSALLEQVADY